MWKKQILCMLALAMAISLFSACGANTNEKSDAPTQTIQTVKAEPKEFTFDVKPETFELIITQDGVQELAANPLQSRPVKGLVKQEDHIEWEYPQDQMKVSIQKQDQYLDIQLESTGAEQFTWPEVSGESYTLPLWEGKQIPSDDASWKQFLEEETMSWGESFSMNFFAVNKADYALVYVVDNPFNNEVSFDTTSQIEMAFSHSFPSINSNKKYGFRLYVTDKDPVKIAKLYRSYIQEKQQFTSIMDKAKDNPAIEKLYGAPHVYMWNDQVLTEHDVNWQKSEQFAADPIWNWIMELLDQHTEDGSGELKPVLDEVKGQGTAYEYQKRVMLRSLNQVMKLKELYDEKHFTKLDADTKSMASAGVESLSEQKQYELNKRLIKSQFGDILKEMGGWGAEDSSQLIKDMQEDGIEQAWVGLPNWVNGLMNPTFVETANESGYLIGPYDSYHSIHKVENREWNTAFFDDPSLYDEATITNKQGEKIGGFLNRGRKLNPTLTLPIVEKRVSDIMQDGVQFNSWFVDCDATGEIYDDYSPAHTTTQEQDQQARLERMELIADKHQMIVGSEGGNDFASQSIAFAHGIETPVIKWADEDMRKNKDSPYYVGGYWSPTGGVPERYSKQVPIKEQYQQIYIDPVYSIPLYKLVYNDSVITSHHWEWGSLKIKDEVASRMLSELLYNVPPLYHLDRPAWEANKGMITKYLDVWSPFHAKAVTKEMTAFTIHSEDRMLQSAAYGSDLQVLVNFSEQEAQIGEQKVGAMSALILDGKERIVFDAAAAAKLGASE